VFYKSVDVGNYTNDPPDLLVHEEPCAYDGSSNHDDSSNFEKSDQEEVSDCNDGSDHDNGSDYDDSSDNVYPYGEDETERFELGEGLEYFIEHEQSGSTYRASRNNRPKNQINPEDITLLGDEVIPEYRDAKYPGVFNPDYDTYVSRTFAPGTPNERTQYYLIKKRLPDFETEEEFHQAVSRMMGLGNWVRNPGAGHLMKLSSLPYAARYAQWITIDPNSEELAPATNAPR
jgi:hypothetical protein